jgi:hypothetical protein
MIREGTANHFFAALIPSPSLFVLGVLGVLLGVLAVQIVLEFDALLDFGVVDDDAEAGGGGER